MDCEKGVNVYISVLEGEALRRRCRLFRLKLQPSITDNVSIADRRRVSTSEKGSFYLPVAATYLEPQHLACYTVAVNARFFFNEGHRLLSRCIMFFECWNSGLPPTSVSFLTSFKECQGRGDKKSSVYLDKVKTVETDAYSLDFQNSFNSFFLWLHLTWDSGSTRIHT